MQGDATALVFKQDTLVPRCESCDQWAQTAKLRMLEATGYISVATAPFEAMVSSYPTRKGSEHVGKLIEWPATHHGHGAVEPDSELTQEMRQLSRHVHQAGCRSDLDKGSIEIEK
jgi:hypothetical protein